MDFAKQQLEKYGWKTGEGLGKNKNGISNPIKAKLKFDNAGLGHNLADEIVNPWWQRVYDSAAENMSVVNKDNEVQIETVGVTEVTTKKRKKKKKNNEVKEKYGNFVKKAALTWQGEQKIGSDDEVEEHEPLPKKRTSGICDLTDEELFKACGGRTVHKGARHGLRMSAKLERSKRYEEELLAKMKKSTGSVIADDKEIACDVEDTTVNEPSKSKSKKKKKEKKHKSTADDNEIVAQEEDSSCVTVDEPSKSKKKKKRHHKSYDEC